MRITILIRSLDGGGAERQAVTLASGLARRGHHATLVTLHATATHNVDGVPVVPITRGRLGLLLLPTRVALALRRQRPDVVLSYLGGPNLLALAAKPWLRGAAVVWGVRATAVVLRHEVWLARLVHRIEPRLSRFADLVIVNAERARDDAVARGFAPKRLAVVPNGIDIHRYRPDAARGPAVRAELGLRPDDEVVGRVGRLHPMKGIEGALAAVATLAPARPSLRLVIVGDGDPAYRRRLLDEARRHDIGNRVLWLGQRDDLPALYCAFDIAVSSSSYGEASPNVVGEAMACGVPCVVTDVGDSATLVGDTGITVPPGAPAALAAAIAALLDDVDSLRSTRCRERIERHYSASDLAERTLRAVEPLRTRDRGRRRRCAASPA